MGGGHRRVIGGSRTLLDSAAQAHCWTMQRKHTASRLTTTTTRSLLLTRKSSGSPKAAEVQCGSAGSQTQQHGPCNHDQSPALRHPSKRPVPGSTYPPPRRHTIQLFACEHTLVQHRMAYSGDHDAQHDGACGRRVRYRHRASTLSHRRHSRRACISSDVTVG